VTGSRLDRSLLGEMLPPLLVALVLYASLAVVGLVVPRLAWIAGAPWLSILRWTSDLLPQALVQTVPMALLLAVFVGIGRLRHDREWMAWHAAGISTARLLRPLFVLATGLALAVLGMNQWSVPAANAAALVGYERLAAAQSSLFRLAVQGVPITGFTLRAERVLADGTLLGVRLERWDGGIYTLLRAERGRLLGRELLLYDHRTQRFDLALLVAAPEGVGDPWPSLVRLDARATGDDAPLMISTGVDEAALVARLSAGDFGDRRSLPQLLRSARDEAASHRVRREAAAVFHRRLAEGVASLALVWAAIPLALRATASRSAAIGTALLLSLLWYLASAAGQTLAFGGAWPAWLGAWGANLLFAGIGLVGTALRGLRTP
jgi:lipopolysaccharide export LptBFGC system permease protein LptF